MARVIRRRRRLGMVAWLVRLRVLRMLLQRIELRARLVGERGQGLLWIAVVVCGERRVLLLLLLLR